MAKLKVSKVAQKAAGNEPNSASSNGHTSTEQPSAAPSEPLKGHAAGNGELKWNHRSTANHDSATMPASGKAPSSLELAEKIKELVRLAQEQGYLTYNDINEVLPENIAAPEDLDEVLIKLRSLEVEIVDQAEVDRVKQPEPEEEDEKARLDILDDPVRMYLKQMGQVPLLTREQEVEISKRIEDAEHEIKLIIYSLGFSAKEHIALAEKLVCEPPKERYDRVILGMNKNPDAATDLHWSMHEHLADGSVVDWTDSAAIKKPDAGGKMSNTLSIEVGADKVRFLVNGTEVTAVDAAKVDTAGTPGLRVNHNLNLHIEGFAIKPR